MYRKPQPLLPELEVELLVTRAEKKLRALFGSDPKATKQKRAPRIPGIVTPRQKVIYRPRKYPWTTKPVVDTPCGSCMLNRSKQVWLEGNPKTAKLLVIGDSPTVQEETMHKAFAGQTAIWFKQQLVEAGIDLKDCAFTHAIKCRNLAESEEILEHAREICTGHFLRKEIEETSAQYILLCGGLALKSVLDLNSISLARAHGYLIQGKWIIPTFHPLYIQKNEEAAEKVLFKNDLHKVAQLVYKKDVLKYDFKCITNMDEFNAAIEDISKSDGWSFDLEYNTLDAWSPEAKIICFAISVRDYQAYFFPVSEKLIEHHKMQLDLVQMKVALKNLFSNVSKKGGHFVKSDARYLEVVWGMHVENLAYDSVLSHYLLDSRQGSHGLDVLAWNYTEGAEYDEEVVAHVKAGLSEQVGIDKLQALVHYNCLDADFSRRIAKHLQNEIKENKLEYPLYQILIPSIESFVHVEVAGMKVDVPALLQYKVECEDKISKLEEFLAQFTPKPKECDFNSNHYKAWLLYEVHNLPILGRTAKKAPSVDNFVLELLISQLTKKDKNHELLPLLAGILDWQGINKTYSTYVVGWLKQMKSDQKLHPTYTTDITVTGRTSCTEPNMQNVPNEIRRFIISSFEGGSILQGDYKQAEVRFAALLSGDTHLKQLFRDGLDPYRYVAARAYNKSEADVTDDERERGKPALLARMYLGEAATVAAGLKISVTDANTLLCEVDAAFPRVKAYAEKVKQEIRRTLQIQSPFNGRIRKFSRAELERNELHVFRQAVNFPHQSNASDLTLQVLHSDLQMIKSFNLQTLVIGDIHDSVLNDCPPDEVDTALQILSEVMEHPAVDWLDIPMKADFKVGRSWGEGVKVVRT